MTTPLFGRFLKQLTLPLKRRIIDTTGLQQDLDDVSPFECTAIYPYAFDVGERYLQGVWSERSLFLPHRKTWLEFGEAEGRAALLLTGFSKDADGIYRRAKVKAFSQMRAGRFEIGDFGFLDLRDAGDRALIGVPNNIAWRRHQFEALIIGLLTLINTPKHVHSEARLPHAGLQRKLAAANGMVGKYPLKAWSEVKLICGVEQRSESGQQYINLSGQKCWHRVRAHARYIKRSDLWTMVKEHEKGNAALGMKQTKYKCEMDRRAA